MATLAYLAMQIRQNTLSNRDANVPATHDMILRVNSALIDNPEMADLLLIKPFPTPSKGHSRKKPA